MNTINRYKNMALGFLWVLIERIGQVLSLIVVNWLLARQLNISDFGNWQYAYSVSGILMALSWFCGAEVTLPRLIDKNDQEVSRVVSQVFFIRLFVSAFFSVITLVFALNQSDHLIRNYLIGFTVSVLVREPMMIGFVLLQSKKKIDLAAKSLVFGIFIRLLVLLAWHVWYPNPQLVWIPWVIENICVGVLLFVFSGAKVSWHLFRTSKDNKDILGSGVFTWLALLLSIAFMKIDKIFLRQFLTNDTQFSLYATASQLNENLLSISSILLQVLLPYYFFRLHDTTIFIKRINQASVFFFLGLCIVSFLGFVSCQFFIPIVYGNAFEPSASVFRSLVFLLPVWGLDSLANNAFYKLNKPHFVIIKWLLALFLLWFSFFALSHVLATISALVVSMYIAIFGSFALGMIALQREKRA